jgi:hypothetical protein
MHPMTQLPHLPRLVRRATGAARPLACAGAIALAALAATGGSVAAQTPLPVSVANLIRFCLFGPDGLRPAQTAFELEYAVQKLQNTPRGVLSQAAPGLYRFSQTNPTMTLELKLPDAQGAGHCLAYGPALNAGDAAAAADKFVEFRFLGDSMTALPTSGTITRRYSVPNLPYTLELLAYGADGFGNIVGLSFSGVQPGTGSKRLAPAGTASDAVVQQAIGGALLACARHIGNAPALRPAIEAAGFVYERPADSQGDRLIYFGASDTVRVNAGGFRCEIESASIQAGTSAQLVSAYLNAQLPGQFTAYGTQQGRCASFIRQSGASAPLSISVRNPGSNGNAPCNPAGASVIHFEVPG